MDMEVVGFSILVYVVAAAVGGVVMALACAWLAEQKGRDKITWGVLGLVLGIIALIILATAPSLTKKE